MPINENKRKDFFLNRLKVYSALLAVGLSLSISFFPGSFPGITPKSSEGREFLNWALGALILTLCLYSLKKRRMIMSFGKLSTWYSIHFFLGLSVMLLLPVHTGFVTGGGLSIALTLVLFFIALNGIYGFTVHFLTPNKVLTLELRNETFTCLRERQKKLEQNIQLILTGKSPGYIALYRQIIKTRKSGLLRFFLNDPAHPENLSGPGSLLAKIPERERLEYFKMKSVLDELFTLKDQIRVIAFLNRWQIYHISAVTCLMLLLFFHITSYYYY
ncbi:MAG: hypothetical protein ACE5FU_00025 [Nitrospinota bacterium]